MRAVGRRNSKQTEEAAVVAALATNTLAAEEMALVGGVALKVADAGLDVAWEAQQGEDKCETVEAWKVVEKVEPEAEVQTLDSTHVVLLHAVVAA